MDKIELEHLSVKELEDLLRKVNLYSYRNYGDISTDEVIVESFKDVYFGENVRACYSPKDFLEEIIAAFEERMNYFKLNLINPEETFYRDAMVAFNDSSDISSNRCKSMVEFDTHIP